MQIDTQEIERIGGRAKNPDIDAALHILEINGLLITERCLNDKCPRGGLAVQVITHETE